MDTSDPFRVERRAVAGVDVLVASEPIVGDLRDLLLMASRHDPVRPYLIDGDRVVTFGELLGLVGGRAANLASLGVGPGDRVAVLAANSIDWVLTAWATVVLDAIVVGCNAWWHPNEAVAALQLTTPKVLVVDARRHDALGSRLSALDIDHVQIIGDLGSFAPAPLPTTPIDPDDTATILFTSGTTGRAKGVVGTHRAATETYQNITWAGARYFPTVLLRPPSAPLLPPATVLSAPMFHVAGLQWGVMFPVGTGTTVVLNTGRYDAGAVMDMVARHRVTSLGGVPTMMSRIVDAPARHDADLSSITTVSWGGAPPAPTLIDQCLATFPNLTLVGTGYGLTETCGLLLYAAGTDYVDRPHTAGRPLPTAEVRVCGPGDEPRPVGEEGEVQLRGPMVMRGYWARPDASAEALTDDGWFRSGDLGRLDADGFLTLTGRIKELIIRGGENIHPVEVEEVLALHPAVLDAAVVGRPHADLGEEVVGVVQVVAGATVTEAELQGHVAGHLAAFKVPIALTLTADALPRNAAGKLMRDTIATGESRLTETL